MKNIPDTRMFESVFAVRRRAMRSCQFFRPIILRGPNSLQDSVLPRFALHKFIDVPEFCSSFHFPLVSTGTQFPAHPRKITHIESTSP